MQKIYAIFFFLVVFSLPLSSQKGYHIKFNYKGCKDSSLYLVKYFWDQLPLVDSCKKIKNGKAEFKGEMALDEGIYLLVNQSKSSFYFQFMVDNKQHFVINLDASDMTGTLHSPDSKANEEFFNYVRFATSKNKEMGDYSNGLKGKPDSSKLVSEKQIQLNKDVKKYDDEFMARNKGGFITDLMNLKAEKYAPEIPKDITDDQAKQLYVYGYYKSHFLDGINFKDPRYLRTPFFADKIKKYLEQLTTQHPDSIIREMDVILGKCEPGSEMFNTLLGHYTYKFETSKAMSFDQFGKANTMEKVFVHLADKYIISGMTNGYYSDETVAKIKERVDILRNLLPGVKLADFYGIDTANGAKVLKLGFDTVKTSVGATLLYNNNAHIINPMFRRLYEMDAKYTILVFWAADCGHCQTEVPKLSEDLAKLKGKIDFKVYAVQTKEDLYSSWKTFIREKKLNDFLNVFDPVHINNLKTKYDIQGTPVIFLLDREKRIIGRKLATENVVDIINKLEEIEKNNKKNN